MQDHDFGGLDERGGGLTFFETHFTRKAQAGLWGWGLAAYALCSGFCVMKLWENKSKVEPLTPALSPSEGERENRAPSLGERRSMGAPGGIGGVGKMRIPLLPCSCHW